MMIEDAERAGILRPGMRIVEATAGNTGLGLALVGSQKGYRCTFVVPDKMSREKIAHLRAFGAEVILTRSDVDKGHPDSYQDRAKAIADSDPDAWYADQFNNLSNLRAHELTTGPELGLTKYFRSIGAKVDMVLADPEGSVIAPYFHTKKVPA
jgi:cystathionine beta-synthase